MHKNGFTIVRTCNHGCRRHLNKLMKSSKNAGRQRSGVRNHCAARDGNLLYTPISQTKPETSTPNAPQNRSILRGILTSWYRLNWLRFSVQKVIHHDDVMCPVIIRPRSSIAGRDAHSGDAHGRVLIDNAEKGQTSIARRGWDKAAEEQPAVGAEALDFRAGLTVTVLIAGPAPIRQVNVRENCSEATDLSWHVSIGAGYEEQRLSNVAVHWGEKPHRAEGAEYGAIGRIDEERSQAALRPTRKRSLRKPRPRRGELSAARVEECVERRDRRCRRIAAPTVPVDFAVTVCDRPWIVVIVFPPGSI